MSRLTEAELARLRQQAEGAAFYDAFGGGVLGEEFPPSTVLALLDHLAALSEERDAARAVLADIDARLLDTRANLGSLRLGVQMLHQPGPAGYDGPFCVTCLAEQWPCPTVTLLDGAGRDEWRPPKAMRGGHGVEAAEQ